MFELKASANARLRIATALLIALSSSVSFANNSLDFCKNFIVKGIPALNVHFKTGSLASALEAGANQSVPVAYTLQSLGLQWGAAPIQVKSESTQTDFFWTNQNQHLALPVESFEPSSLLVVENDGSLEWFFMSYGKYKAEAFTPEKLLTLPTGASTKFHHILMPEVWQTLSAKERPELVRSAYQALEPGGTLRLTIRIPDVEKISPEMKDLASSESTQSLLQTMKEQVAAALPSGAKVNLLTRVQVVSFQPSEEDLKSEAFHDTLGPNVTEASALKAVGKPALQILFVVRKPGAGLLEWIAGY